MPSIRTHAFTRPSLASIGTAGARALAIAVPANVLLFVATSAAGIFGPSSAGAAAGPSPVPSLGAIVGMSSMATLVAALLFAVLTRFAPRPGTLFVVAAAAVFVGFVPGPLTLGAPVGTVVTLQAMHIVVAVPIVASLLRTLAPVQEPLRDGTWRTSHA